MMMTWQSQSKEVQAQLELVMSNLMRRLQADTRVEVNQILQRSALLPQMDKQLTSIVDQLQDLGGEARGASCVVLTVIYVR